MNTPDLSEIETTDLDFDVWALLSNTFHLISEHREMELNRYKISGGPAFILFVSHCLGDNATPTVISKYTYLKLNSITQIIDRMVKSGLVTKNEQKTENGRLTIKLTDKGRETLANVIRRESIHKVMSALSVEQKKQLKSILNLLVEKIVNEPLITPRASNLAPQLMMYPSPKR